MDNIFDWRWSLGLNFFRPIGPYYVLQLRFNVFYVFSNPKRDFLTFFALLHTFSPTMLTFYIIRLVFALSRPTRYKKYLRSDHK